MWGTHGVNSSLFFFSLWPGTKAGSQSCSSGAEGAKIQEKSHLSGRKNGEMQAGRCVGVSPSFYFTERDPLES